MIRKTLSREKVHTTQFTKCFAQWVRRGREKGSNLLRVAYMTKIQIVLTCSTLLVAVLNLEWQTRDTLISQQKIGSQLAEEKQNYIRAAFELHFNIFQQLYWVYQPQNDVVSIIKKGVNSQDTPNFRHLKITHTIPQKTYNRPYPEKLKTTMLNWKQQRCLKFLITLLY